MTQLRRSRTPGLKARPWPRLREASFADFEQIAALAVRHGLAPPRSQEAWRHLWLANPHYREREGNWTIGWVLEDDAGRIVASIENIPLAYEFQGARVLAASGRGWVADKEYRSGSLLLLEHVITQPTIDLYVNSTFSEASMPAITVFGCSRVPVGMWDEAAFWVTDHPAFCEELSEATGQPARERAELSAVRRVVTPGAVHQYCRVPEWRRGPRVREFRRTLRRLLGRVETAPSASAVGSSDA